MNRIILDGLNGSNPLGFMASVGLLRVLDRTGAARLGFSDDGSFRAWIEASGQSDVTSLAAVVAADAASCAGPRPWRLEYEKGEKRGVKVVADLKPPPERFSTFLALAIEEWALGDGERAEFAAAYATDVARDGKGNTKPTAFHFTAAQQQFLGTVEELRKVVDSDWAECALRLPGQSRPGYNLRWDPGADRSRAMMGVNPTEERTTVNAPLEWLAFRALPAFPCFPSGDRVVTCGVTGRRQNELRFHWPLWSSGASYPAVRSLLVLAAGWILEEERTDGSGARGGSSHGLRGSGRHAARAGRRERGVFALCTSCIRRTSQGFGNFAPAHVRA